MNQETARKLYEEGAIFVFLDVPEGTEFGIDLKSWNTGEKFRGVKMVPPGIHYIFYSSVSNTGDVAPRIGFFHNFRKGEMLVKKWDKNLETMSAESVNNIEVVRLRDSLRELDGFLGPYPYDILDKWKVLTSHISLNLIKKLEPVCGQIQSALELVSCSDADRPRGKKITDDASSSINSSKNPKRKRSTEPEDLLPDLKPKEGTQIRTTPFPVRNYPEGATPSEITKHSLDSSYILETLIATYEEPTDIVGELQFCFVCFLVGHSLEAFEHWKKLFSLFCSCETGIKTHRKLYDIFLTVIEVQIKEIPEEFLADIVSNNNLVYVKLRDLFRTLKDSEVDGQVKCKAERLKKTLTDHFQWDFKHLDSEDEEDAPVIVM